ACQLFLSPALWLWASLRCPPARLPRFRISASRRDRRTSLKPPSVAGAAFIPTIGAAASRAATAITGGGMTAITAAATSGRGVLRIITAAPRPASHDAKAPPGSARGLLLRDQRGRGR